MEPEYDTAMQALIERLEDALRIADDLDDHLLGALLSEALMRAQERLVDPR